ncbi:MAG: hypothetical protein NC344_08145 [Bacteroidales bacterium]|nr:hypothetical protein [Bacteroidales bacterium]MCM1147785.1 hypothetical protein [Bacteroidales bacterium]MCM1206605.1 hypothetical protein [Bacillota bacterium]MCM1510654.1 hypothetical protein [Clostridium sp.]
MMKVRERNVSVPDHYYRLGNEFSFQRISRISELFTVGLAELAEDYLEIRGDKVYAKGDKFNDWQLLLPDIPPLLLTVLRIWKHYGPMAGSPSEYACRYLLPSLKTTALPSAYIPEMEMFVKERDGLCDLHLHLNGAVETDCAWHDFIRYPERTYAELKKAYQADKVKEQYEQVTGIISPIAFFDLFCIAGRLREWLFSATFARSSIFIQSSLSELLEKVAVNKACYREHPIQQFFGEHGYPLMMEAVLYIKVFDFLSANPDNDTVACMFHYYLLILGLCHKMLVQQTDAYGFEQFQKYTSNNMREFSEQTYTERFMQLAGNQLDRLRHVEGRFSSKKSLEENVALVDKIMTGFNFLNRRQHENNVNESTMSLVAHFIKKPDTGCGQIRFKNLRTDLKHRTDALIALMNAKGKQAEILVGIDAAASEFDAPPEVFATVFRRLRDHGMKHFTYHAGEDFFHILSGLRAIYEAVIFLGLETGDRIGHATAAGVDVVLWKENIGEKLWMRKEDYMMDLIFAYHLILEYKEERLKSLLPMIALKVEEYAAQIYQEPCNTSELIMAWNLRKEDPESFYDRDFSELSKVERLYAYYHTQDIRKKGMTIIEVDAYDIFDEEALTVLQQLVLRFLHEKQLVIETLPTSNVVIGQHHGFKTYHIYNWYKWSRQGLKLPPIVVGTDDAGIFATNIYNEYCHIYSLLVFEKGLSPHEVMPYIERLDHNSKVYAFRN